MFCPHCKVEYRAGATRCNDCDVLLVDGLPSQESGEVPRELLWRGVDPSMLSALQEALQSAGIPFVDSSLHVLGSSLGSEFPAFFDSTPAFELRVNARDFIAARGVLKELEEVELEDSEIPDTSPLEGEGAGDPPLMPENWDPDEATAEAWVGDGPEMAKYITDALAENGIPSVTPDEPGNRPRICVRAEDLARAREIVREVVEGAPPA